MYLCHDECGFLSHNMATILLLSHPQGTPTLLRHIFRGTFIHFPSCLHKIRSQIEHHLNINCLLFLHFQLSSSYYVYQVAKKLYGAEKILLCMGYEPVSGSASEIQELKYDGEVNTWRATLTATDLVILHSELDRIRDLVMGAIQSNYINVTLRDILEARGDPNDTLYSTLQRSLTCSLVRLRNSRQAQVAQQSRAPALDTHDLEMFHQEACNVEDPYASSTMCLLINPRQAPQRRRSMFLICDSIMD